MWTSEQHSTDNPEEPEMDASQYRTAEGGWVKDAPFWTIAYRNPRANRFVRVSDFAGTWQEAHDAAGVFAEAHTGLQVYYVPTADAEAAGYGYAEDHGTVLVDSGRRVKMIDRPLGDEVATLRPTPAPTPAPAAAEPTVADRVAADQAAAVWNGALDRAYAAGAGSYGEARRMARDLLHAEAERDAERAHILAAAIRAVGPGAAATIIRAYDDARWRYDHGPAAGTPRMRRELDDAITAAAGAGLSCTPDCEPFAHATQCPVGRATAATERQARDVALHGIGSGTLRSRPCCSTTFATDHASICDNYRS
jgi:hypothetical protein